MATVNVVVKNVLNLLLTKLEGGYFDEDLINVAENEMTGAELNDTKFVENFIGEIHDELANRLRRA